MNFKELEKQGKTVIYEETTTDEQLDGWDLWGERTTPNEHVYVWRKIVTFEEAKQYEFDNAY